SWAGQQPSMMKPADLLRSQHRSFGDVVANESIVAPRWRPIVRPFELLEFSRVDACLAAGHRSGLQSLGHEPCNGERNALDVTARIDHDASLRLLICDFQKSGADTIVELTWQAFIASLHATARLGTGQSRFDRHVQDQRQVGTKVPDGDLVKP